MVAIKINGQDLGPILQTFSDVKKGQPLAYIGSGGHLEIAVREGSAQDHFSLSNDREIEIEVASA